MLGPGGLYFLERFIVQDTQVDAGDFSVERSCDRLDFDPPIGCHGFAPFIGDSASRKPTGQLRSLAHGPDAPDPLCPHRRTKFLGRATPAVLAAPLLSGPLVFFSVR